MIVLVFWLFLFVLFWPRIRNVVRLRMLLGFLSLPGQLIRGLGMGEFDGVTGVGGLYVTDGWASEQDGQSVFGSFCLRLPRSHAIFLHWLTKINGPFSLFILSPMLSC